MRIPALALAQRALVLDARGHHSCLLRVLLVVLSLLALGIAITISGWFGAPGLTFYYWLGSVKFWFIVAFGISEFTTVVTEETALTVTLFQANPMRSGSEATRWILSLILLGLALCMHPAIGRLLRRRAAE